MRSDRTKIVSKRFVILKGKGSLFKMYEKGFMVPKLDHFFKCFQNKLIRRHLSFYC